MSGNTQILVSVVIPTHNRAALVPRAVKSALAQSFEAIEVIVIIDGPDPSTVAALREIQDRRLRILPLPQNVGGAAARNAGVKNATGEWIAFLDDDDEWLPCKIERQVKAALNSQYQWPIVASAIIAKTPRSEFVWPRKSPTIPLSEYLFARNSWAQGEGLLQTSTLLARRDLLLSIPFKEGLKKHQDWDWLLRAAVVPGVGVEFVPEPLAIWNLEETRKTVSTTSDWKHSLTWIRDSRSLVTKRAYAGFFATQLSSQASREHAWQAFFPLLREAICEGEPKPIDIFLYVSIWLVPPSVRRWFRSKAEKSLRRHSRIHPFYTRPGLKIGALLKED